MESAKSRRKAFPWQTLCLLLCLFLTVAADAAIGPPPLIDVQPTSLTVLKGTSATFLVSAISTTTLSYQWRLNGQSIAGATQSAYSLGSAQSNASYSVDVINASGTIPSSNAFLTILLAPQASADSYTNLENHSLSVVAPGLLANDVEPNGLGLTAILKSSPAHGTLLFNPNGSFQYTPNTAYHGSDSFTYAASDGLFSSSTVTVKITVQQIIQAPLSFVSGRTKSDGFEVELSGPAPATYIIFASSDLNQWIPIATNTVLSGKLEFLDKTAPRNPVRFYRAVSQQNW
jgi:hypothetical protein